MNKMNFKIAIIYLLSINICLGQAFKYSKSTGVIRIEIKSGLVEAYEGKEVLIDYLNESIFENEEEDVEDIVARAMEKVENIEEVQEAREINVKGMDDSRSTRSDNMNKNLRVLSATGVKDNTGFGLSLKENEKGEVEIVQIANKSTKRIHIKIPKEMVVKVKYDKMTGERIKIKNTSNELEVSVTNNDIYLENISGPTTVKTIYGDVEGSISPYSKGPISIIAMYQDVDLTLPKTLKANLTLAAPYGDVMADQELNFDIEPSNKENNGWLNETIKGKLNGGGLTIDIKCNYGKIMLR